MMKFVVWAVVAKSVLGQTCTAEQGLTVTSSTYPGNSGCYQFAGLENGFPKFGSSVGLIIPYTYDLFSSFGTESHIITRWLWGFRDESGDAQFCDLDVLLSNRLSIPWNSWNPANSASLTGYSTAGDAECGNVQVEFSCGCSTTPEPTEPTPTPATLEPTPTPTQEPDDSSLDFDSEEPTFEPSQMYFDSEDFEELNTMSPSPSPTVSEEPDDSSLDFDSGEREDETPNVTSSAIKNVQISVLLLFVVVGNITMIFI